MNKSTSKFISDEEMAQKVVENSFIYEQYFDPEYAKSLSKNIFIYIDRYYFRSEFYEFDDEPRRKPNAAPLIYVGNHSGMAFPWDAIMFNVKMFIRNNYSMYNSIRTIVAPQLSKLRLMNAFLVPNFWQRNGGIPATTLNFETMMHYKESNVFVYPEGIKGIGKGFNNKYEIQRFATSFIRMGLKYNSEIVPIACVNGEYINPYSFSIPFINKLSSKIGIPFLPISPMVLFLPFCPWLFYFAFPAKLIYVKGKTIRLSDLTNKTYQNISPDEIEALRDKVQAIMQQQLIDAVEKYENKTPFKLRELFKIIFTNRKSWPFMLSPFWPLLFDEHERQYQKNKQVKIQFGFFHFIKALIKNPKALAFYLPIIGWIFIIYRGYFRKSD